MWQPVRTRRDRGERSDFPLALVRITSSILAAKRNKRASRKTKAVKNLDASDDLVGERIRGGTGPAFFTAGQKTEAAY